MSEHTTTLVLVRARACIAFALAAALLAFGADRAAASATQLSIMEDDTELHTSRMDSRLDEMKALRADVVKVRLPWRYIAPQGSTKPSGFDPTNPSSYPAGVWDSYDAIIRGIVARHMR